MIKLSNRNGISIATPFKSLLSNCKQIIISIPAAIRKFPHTNVFGKRINIDANKVTAPLIITAFLLKFHLPNISSISGFAVSIFHPCLAPINTANKINAELRIFKIIIFKFKKRQKTKSFAFLKIVKFILSCCVASVCKNGLPCNPPTIGY